MAPASGDNKVYGNRVFIGQPIIAPLTRNGGEVGPSPLTGGEPAYCLKIPKTTVSIN